MPNRLADELSPYLLQHAGNPVPWHAWGSEAIELARSQDRPIFLSIGYSSCHWCHVMAHESFEDEAIARQLAEGFVSIKVDREERPDLDQVYMEAVQMMTGHGGWPMSVFLTPSLQPFFGGTYWPSHARRGMPGFDEILAAVANAWRVRKADCQAQSDEITRSLRENRYDSPGPARLDERPLALVEDALRQSFDPRYGGFSGAPKFPQAMLLSLLLRRGQRNGRDDLLDMAGKTLDAMARGGIYDHVGGGFHRYSVDNRWLVPHFEKMLYDNALLAGCYLDAFAATGNAAHAQVVRETLDYLLRDMTLAAGGFCSSEDADSEGQEGKFYVWTRSEIDDALRDQRPGDCPDFSKMRLFPSSGLPGCAEAFARVYDVTATGNFEGQNILNLSRPLDLEAKLLGRSIDALQAELTDSRQRLLEVRQRRTRPGRDDKVLTSCNALAIDAFARAGAALAEPRYAAAAAKTADFLLAELRDSSGRLLHCWRAGRAKVPAMLDDCAGLVNALTTLGQTTGESRWTAAAVKLAEDLLIRFSDPTGGGLFYTAVDHEPLIARKKDVLDASVPSGNGLAATALVRLGRQTGRTDLLAAAEKTLEAFYAFTRQMPTSAGQMLLALDDLLAGPVPSPAGRGLG